MHHTTIWLASSCVRAVFREAREREDVLAWCLPTKRFLGQATGSNGDRSTQFRQAIREASRNCDVGTVYLEAEEGP